MPNPFPGMNPYFQEFAGDVQTWLTVSASDQMTDQLPQELHARIDHVELPLARSGREPFHQRFIVIRDSSHADAAVTFLAFLHPVSKATRPARDAYRRVTADFFAIGVNIVEVDLFTGGGHVLRIPYEMLPCEMKHGAMICQHRVSRSSEFQLYPLPLRERLPVIAVPLRPSDRDVILDLQPLIDQCYERGRYARIDYRRDPEVPFNEADAAWVDTLLREKGLR